MKKFISFLLAAVLLVSAVPMAYATNAADLGTVVSYTAPNDEAWTVTVPAQLAPSSSGTVTLEGKWPSNKTITVVAQKTVTLTNNINSADKKTLNVNFDGIEAAGDNTASQKIEQTVSVAAMPTDALFGTWSGHFYYTVGSTVDDVTPDENYIGTVSADNTITLNAAPAAGTYTLRYANADGALDNYADICSLEVTDPATAVSYDDLIAENCAPVEATTIAVYNEANEKVGDIALGSLATNLGTKLYSFGALADIHIGYEQYNATAKTESALDYLTQTENVAFTCIPGDLTSSANESELSTLKTIISKYPNAPVYVSAGNHETPEYGAAGIENLAEYLENYTGHPLYYSFEYGNDVFLMVGLSANDNSRYFWHGQLQWLQETLEANKDKRCFVFQHLFTQGGSGNPNGFYPHGTMNGQEFESFDSIMSHYKNAIFLHGHSHSILELQSIDDAANYDYNRGAHSIHIPSVTQPRNENGETVTEASQGYAIDVYENGIILRGIDFTNTQLLPIAQYQLDTTPKAIQQDEILVKLGVEWQPGIKLSKTDNTYEEVGYDPATATTTYIASGYIPFDDNATYIAGMTFANYRSLSVCCFDENKNFIGYLNNIIVGPKNDGTRDNVNVEITPPDGTAYIRLRILTPINELNPVNDIIRYLYAYKSIIVS